MEFSFSNRDYQGLTLCESIYISQYFENFDIAPLAEVIRDGVEITDGMRLFIHDIMTGIIKRQPGEKKSTFSRDFNLHGEVEELLSEGLKLRDNKSSIGAASIVGEKYHLSPETIITAYRRIQKAKVEHDKVCRE